MKIAPSVLDADFRFLQAEIDSLALADRIHLDIMDGQYVPQISFGASILKNIKFPRTIEAHLMTDNPNCLFEAFAGLGCEGITFHLENTGKSTALEYVRQLRAFPIRPGICIDAYTEVEDLTDDLLAWADQILVMSVKAGKGGQSFHPEALEKVKALRKRGYKGEIEVDGGVNLENAPLIKAAGADIVVVGSALMKLPVEQRADFIRRVQAI